MYCILSNKTQSGRNLLSHELVEEMTDWLASDAAMTSTFQAEVNRGLFDSAIGMFVTARLLWLVS